MLKGPRGVSHLCAGALQGCRGRSLGVGVLLEQVRDRSEAGRLGHVGQDSRGLQSPLLQAQQPCKHTVLHKIYASVHITIVV